MFLKARNELFPAVPISEVNCQTVTVKLARSMSEATTRTCVLSWARKLFLSLARCGSLRAASDCLRALSESVNALHQLDGTRCYRFARLYAPPATE